LFLEVFELYHGGLCYKGTHVPHFTQVLCIASAESDELLSKFTTSEKPYGVGYVMKISKCTSLQIIHYGKWHNGFL